MQTRTKNGLAALVLVAALGLCIFALIRSRPPASLRSRSLEAVPAGALVVAALDLDALRATSIGPKILGKERDIPGLGKVRDVCGIDPMERVRELVLVIPAAGDNGDFGVIASGEIPDEEILACASKVIEKRGGKPIVSSVGSFRTVRDATLVLSGAEIATRKGGPILFGAGSYLRAMIDAADGKIETIRSSVAHARLGEQVRGSTMRATIVLTPPQRKELQKSLAEEGGPKGAGSVAAGALGVSIAQNVTIHGVIACDDSKGCAEVAELLKRARDERAASITTKIVGFSRVLEGIQIRAESETVQINAEIPVDEAMILFERLLVLRGVDHPMPRATATAAEAPPAREPDQPAAGTPDQVDAGASDALAPPAPNEVLTAKGDAGPAPNDAGSRDAAK